MILLDGSVRFVTDLRDDAQRVERRDDAVAIDIKLGVGRIRDLADATDDVERIQWSDDTVAIKVDWQRTEVIAVTEQAAIGIVRFGRAVGVVYRQSIVRIDDGRQEIDELRLGHAVGSARVIPE